MPCLDMFTLLWCWFACFKTRSYFWFKIDFNFFFNANKNRTFCHLVEIISNVLLNTAKLVMRKDKKYERTLNDLYTQRKLLVTPNNLLTESGSSIYSFFQSVRVKSIIRLTITCFPFYNFRGKKYVKILGSNNNKCR